MIHRRFQLATGITLCCCSRKFGAIDAGINLGEFIVRLVREEGVLLGLGEEGGLGLRYIANIQLGTKRQPTGIYVVAFAPLDIHALLERHRHSTNVHKGSILHICWRIQPVNSLQ